jgi:uncharacterized protein YdaU (DUF1376 family)
MWRSKGILPNDDKRLARYAGVNAGQWKRMKPTLFEFFDADDEWITQGRLWDELEFVRENSQKNSKAAKKRWHREKGKSNIENAESESQRWQSENSRSDAKSLFDNDQDYANASSGQCERNAPTPTPTKDPPSLRESPPKKKKSRKIGTRLPENWKPSQENLDYAAAQGFEQDEINRIALDFADYWIAKSGQAATKVDWSRTWQKWIRTEADRRGKPSSTFMGQKSAPVRARSSADAFMQRRNG